MVVRTYNGEQDRLRRAECFSAKGKDLSTSLYQLLYCCKRRGGQNIDCSSHCQIKNVSKQKAFVFRFFHFFLRQFFVRSKINFLIFLFFLISNLRLFSKSCCCVYFPSSNPQIQTILWFDSFCEGKKLPSPRSCLLSVSLAGDGR